MEKPKPFLTESRRDFIQRAALNVFTVTYGAAFASNFFTAFPWPARILIVAAGLTTFLGGLIVKKEKKENGDP